MNLINALILGIVQGITEFVPISSDGHLELAKAILKINIKDNLEFNLVVHLATIIALIIVFFPDIKNLATESVKKEGKKERTYIFYILVAAIPVAILELIFGDKLENLYTGNLVLTGICLIATGTLLLISYVVGKNNTKSVNIFSAFIIGIAQAVAVLPGLSRSGSTIATSLILGIKKEEATKFSFLIVIIPILGASFLWGIDLLKVGVSSDAIGYLTVGFFSSLITGILAAKFILNIIKQNKLYYFGFYCLIVGGITLLTQIS